jgi:hypothetical protein
MSNASLPTFDEALRLALAFYCIMEPEKRAVVMALVEKFADPSRLIDAQIQEAITLFASPESASPVAHQAALPNPHRDYVDQLRDTNFSIIENAIEQLVAPGAPR